MIVKPLTKTTFSGTNGEAENALYSAFMTASQHDGHKEEYGIYEWLELIPRASMVIALVSALKEHGYEIRKKKPQ